MGSKDSKNMIIVLLLIIGFVLGIVAYQESQEGPFEEAAESIGETIEDAGDEIEDSADGWQ